MKCQHAKLCFRIEKSVLRADWSESYETKPNRGCMKRPRVPRTHTVTKTHRKIDPVNHHGNVLPVVLNLQAKEKKALGVGSNK